MGFIDRLLGFFGIAVEEDEPDEDLFEPIHFKARQLSKQKAAINLPAKSSIGSLLGRTELVNRLLDDLTGGKNVFVRCVAKPSGACGLAQILEGTAWVAIDTDLGSAAFRLSASTPLGLQFDLASLGKRGLLGLHSDDKLSLAERCTVVKNWFKSYTGWIVIIEDIDSAQSAEAVRQLLPELTNGRVIMSGSHALEAEGVATHSVDVLDQDASASLLALSLGHSGPVEECAMVQVVDKLGGFPSAIEMVGGFVIRYRSNPKHFGEHWKGAEKWIGNLPGWSQLGWQLPPGLALHLAIDSLHGPARLLLLTLSYLSPAPIPMVILRESEHLFAHRFASSGRLTGLFDLDEAVRNLRSFRLLTGDAKAIQVPGYVAEFSRLVAAAESDRSGLILCEAVMGFLLNCFDDAEHSAGRTGKREALRPHAEALLENTVGGGFDPQRNSLQLHLSRFYLECGLHEIAEKGFSAAITQLKEHRGETHPETIAVEVQLAELLGDSGEFTRSIEIFERLVQFERESPETDPVAVSRWLEKMALVKAAMGNYESALDAQQEALRLKQQIFGLESREVGSALHSLGKLFLALGKLEDAEPAISEALDIENRGAGQESRSAADIMCTLAELYLRQERLQEAEDLAEGALRIGRALYGRTHLFTVPALRTLAGCLIRNGRDDSCIAVLDELLVILTREYGGTHKEVASELKRLALTHMRLKHWKTAKGLLDRVRTVEEALHGPNSEPVLDVIRTQAEMYLLNGLYDDATIYLREALAIMEVNPDVTPELRSALEKQLAAVKGVQS